MNSQTAFTLLEIIIVLVILGFMAGLAVPRLERVYSSIQQSMQRSEILRCVADLGYQAWAHQQTLTLHHYPPPEEASSQVVLNRNITREIFPFPDSWTVMADSPIHYKYNGICSGGTITVLFQSQESRYNLRAPFCVPEHVE